LDALGSEYGERGLVVLAVNVGQPETRYRAFIEDNDYEHLTWIRDARGEAVRRYRVRSLPTAYLVDGEGVIRRVLVGYRKDVKRILAEEIEALLQ
jgi:hypothetical protein